MRPPVDLLEYESYAAAAPQLIRDALPQQFAAEFLSRGFQVQADDPRLATFIIFIHGELSSTDAKAFIEMFPMEAQAALYALPAQFRIEMDRRMEEAVRILPALNALAQKTLHDWFPRNIGVLCMSRNDRNPLMWAHYAGEHRGAMIGFDENAKCFNRKRSIEDEFGTFRPVTYSESRPRLRHDSGDQAFHTLALTKAIEWAYEQEVRLLWPLSLCDTTVNDSIHLLSIPPAAVQSITLGSRVHDTVTEQVVNLLRQTPDTSHIVVRRAIVDSDLFTLNYIPV